MSNKTEENNKCCGGDENKECGCKDEENKSEAKDCASKENCCGKKKHGHSKTAKAAAKAYAEAQKKPEDIEGVLEEVLDEVKQEMAEEEKSEAAEKPAEPDYKLIAHKTAAEFDNYRKRVAREKEIWKRDALGDFLKEFLPAFDDLDRAINEGEKGHSYEVIHDGAKLVRDNLWKTLERSGVVEIDAADKVFDPRYHEAMTMIPMPGKEPNTVIEVFQSGYMIGDFVLRPAKVVVSADV